MLGSLFGVFWLSLAFTGVVQAALALVDGQMFHVEHRKAGSIGMFHVEHSGGACFIPENPAHTCSTWNICR